MATVEVNTGEVIQAGRSVSLNASGYSSAANMAQRTVSRIRESAEEVRTYVANSKPVVSDIQARGERSIAAITQEIARVQGLIDSNQRTLNTPLADLPTGFSLDGPRAALANRQAELQDLDAKRTAIQEFLRAEVFPTLVNLQTAATSADTTLTGISSFEENQTNDAYIGLRLTYASQAIQRYGTAVENGNENAIDNFRKSLPSFDGQADSRIGSSFRAAMGFFAGIQSLSATDRQKFLNRVNRIVARDTMDPFSMALADHQARLRALATVPISSTSASAVDQYIGDGSSDEPSQYAIDRSDATGYGPIGWLHDQGADHPVRSSLIVGGLAGGGFVYGAGGGGAFAGLMTDGAGFGWAGTGAGLDGLGAAGAGASGTGASGAIGAGNTAGTLGAGGAAGGSGAGSAAGAGGGGGAAGGGAAAIGTGSASQIATTQTAVNAANAQYRSALQAYQAARAGGSAADIAAARQALTNSATRFDALQDYFRNIGGVIP